MTVLVCIAFQPESKGVSLEGLDAVFAESPWKQMAKNLHVRKRSGELSTPHVAQVINDGSAVELGVIDALEDRRA